MLVTHSLSQSCFPTLLMFHIVRLAVTRQIIIHDWWWWCFSNQKMPFAFCNFVTGFFTTQNQIDDWWWWWSNFNLHQMLVQCTLCNKKCKSLRPANPISLSPNIWAFFVQCFFWSIWAFFLQYLSNIHYKHLTPFQPNFVVWKLYILLVVFLTNIWIAQYLSIFFVVVILLDCAIRSAKPLAGQSDSSIPPIFRPMPSFIFSEIFFAPWAASPCFTGGENIRKTPIG